MPEHVSWRKVGPIPGVPYADMVAEVLKDKKIPYYLSQDWFSAAYGIRGTSAVGNAIFIFVPEENYQEVRQLIDQMFGDEPADSFTDHEDEG